MLDALELDLFPRNPGDLCCSLPVTYHNRMSPSVKPAD